MISFQFISFQSFPLTEASRSRNPQSRMVISRGAGKDRGGRKEERPPLLHAPTNPPASHLPGPSSSSSSSPPLPPSRPGPQVPPTKQRQRQRHRHRPPRPPRENGSATPSSETESTRHTSGSRVHVWRLGLLTRATERDSTHRRLPGARQSHRLNGQLS
ncbi:taperin-like isoform X4 [Sciurus carolinensis]|uniref:taperin-like isoform X4 n=1 Tax=Sciurus carolinensis TaxID=30640 RepID=UPI001FB1CA0D|nr:taperin-like isoform X4 [Sciurus carolinensis]